MIQLRALSSLKDDLVSLLVHDLRNPLAGIQLLADAARERGGCGASDADAIARAAGRMRATLDDMLKVRLLEDSALPLRRAPHRLSELMAEGVSGIEAAARGRRVGIRIAVDDDVAVPCDLPLVGRAIENLVGNAIRYTPVGGDIDVRAGRVDDTAEIQIGDRGPGMPSGTQAALFDKFGALRAGATDGRQGFGLGLYMARLVLEAHGGSVVAAGREGGGTVFRVSLPGVCA
jgi:two-component system sensor histidine kinase KdpD